jgi:phosphohistidine phosphatase
MTRTLIITRHAKSSWKSPALSDHDRPLNNRGKHAARALGDWFRENGRHPDQVISSDSKRTRDTYAGLGLETAAEFTRDLYHASPNQMLRVLSQATGDVVLMLGHNPGVADFAAELAGKPPDHPKFYDYPTGATLVLRFDVDSWDRAAWQGGEVVDFVVPRDLP